MKKEWEVKKLDDVCNVIGGGTPSKSNSKYYYGGILWATVRDMKHDIIEETEHKITTEAVKYSSTNIIPKGNVIIATRVGLGKVCLLKYDTAINQDLRGVIPKKNSQLSIDFLFHWFKSISHVIEKEGTGATVQGVKLPFIKSLPLPLPPISEQQRIVTILEKAFASIDKSKEIAEKNLQNVRELFQSYLKSVFVNARDKWEVKTLGDVCVITSSKRIFEKEYQKEGVPFYRTKEIKELANNKNVTTEIFISKERYSDIKNHYGVPLEGDILMTAIGTIGEIYVVKSEENFYFKDGNVLWLKNFKSIDSYYLKYALILFIEEIKRLSIGSAYNALPIGKIKNHNVFLPSLPEQRSIVAILDSLSKETKKLEAIYQQKLTNLEELKKSILQKAFDGEL